MSGSARLLALWAVLAAELIGAGFLVLSGSVTFGPGPEPLPAPGPVPVPVLASPVVFAPKPHETSLNAGTVLHAGSESTLRVDVHSVTSALETRPIPGASVRVSLQARGGPVVPLVEGTTGAGGVADLRFKVPAVAPGSYTMVVATKSTEHQETLQRDVTVRSDAKVLLTTDKPLYQPGQMIHIRTLALDVFSLVPVAGKDLTLEVADGKGNTVFKRVLKTSGHGIAASDFTLADEVNQGDYRVRAMLGDQHAERTVTVKPYVMPRFKLALKADKAFYLPGETLALQLQGDYLFGKPLAKAKLKAVASTFDVAFKDFQTFEGATDAAGHATFDIKLPGYFVGQPLASGNGLVKVEVKVTDTADHAETVTKTCPVVEQPVRINVVPEGGRIVPGVENRLFVATSYPDGQPAAACAVKVWLSQQAEGPAFRSITTDATGLAEFVVTPAAGQFRAGPWGQQEVEMLGRQNGERAWLPKNLLDVSAEARDPRGQSARASFALACEPLGENVLLRLDKAVYRAGDSVKVDVRTSGGLPTVYLDVVRDGQVLLTRWLDVKDARANYRLDVPPSVFGSIEVHAYQVLTTGEVVRDARVVYVQPASDLKVEAKADHDVYRPGGEGKIAFRVTDAAGRPTPAALGVIVVDEAVYALQDIQPGLEKVFFTLQEELLKPQVQASYRADTIPGIVGAPELEPERQRVAEVLLTAARPKPPAVWSVDPSSERRRLAEEQVAQIGPLLFIQARALRAFVLDPATGKTSFRPGFLSEAFRRYGWGNTVSNDPSGQPWTPERLATLYPDFNARRLAEAVTRQSASMVAQWLAPQAEYRLMAGQEKRQWVFPDAILKGPLSTGGMLGEGQDQDAWGHTFRLLRRKVAAAGAGDRSPWHDYTLVSAGPDERFDTPDDLVLDQPGSVIDLSQSWWLDEAHRQDPRRLITTRSGRMGGFAAMMGGMGGGMGRMDDLRAFRDELPRGGGYGARMMAPASLAAPRAPALAKAVASRAETASESADKSSEGSGPAAPARVREFFPETMLWQPALITDDAGRATLPLTFADSITAWRLTASASSKGGGLGSTTTPLRVFQDFFVELDLPLNLTRNDEVAIPATVYNYLPEPQTVTLHLEPGAWFDLIDGSDATRTVAMGPNEVKSVPFRIRATRVGHFPLTLDAHGARLSDAVKRVVEVAPEGQRVEHVVSDRLRGTGTHVVDLPASALPDASKLFVKVYPGVMSQVIEGIDGLLRMPGGCMEQTSSTAYPNILVVDYLKTSRAATPELMARAEQYLSVGYQRLLTFERPGGGFDWWGSGPPLIWLSAYGLNEFSDMACVYPIDRGVIDRTRAWLLSQRAPDGTWSNIGATHSESITRMGDPRLLLTSYVTWTLLESGTPPAELAASLAFIRAQVKTAENAYIVALAANALAAAGDDAATREALDRVLQALDDHKQSLPDWKASCFPAGGQSLSYARGDGLTVETTALAALAMHRHGGYSARVSECLTYLVKSKDPQGTWGSTQATILALKALVRASSVTVPEGGVKFTVKVNGSEAATGSVTPASADVLQQFDLSSHLKPGSNKVIVAASDDAGLTYSVVARHFEPWPASPPAEPALAITVDYDRTRLSTADQLKARATLRYRGQAPTFGVIVDLGIAPGFTVNPGDFAEMVGSGRVKKFSVTSRQVTLYLGDVNPGDVLTFDYSLRPRFPLKAKAPATVAYEYYTPASRSESRPVELVVEEATR